MLHPTMETIASKYKQLSCVNNSVNNKLCSVVKRWMAIGDKGKESKTDDIV